MKFFQIWFQWMNLMLVHTALKIMTLFIDCTAWRIWPSMSACLLHELEDRRAVKSPIYIASFVFLDPYFVLPQEKHLIFTLDKSNKAIHVVWVQIRNFEVIIFGKVGISCCKMEIGLLPIIGSLLLTAGRQQPDSFLTLKWYPRFLILSYTFIFYLTNLNA